MNWTIVIFVLLAITVLVVVSFLSFDKGMKRGMAIKDDPVGILHIDSKTIDGELLTVELRRTIPELQTYEYVIFEIDNKN